MAPDQLQRIEEVLLQKTYGEIEQEDIDAITALFFEWKCLAEQALNKYDN